MESIAATAAHRRPTVVKVPAAHAITKNGALHTPAQVARTVVAAQATSAVYAVTLRSDAVENYCSLLDQNDAKYTDSLQRWITVRPAD